MGEGGVAGHGCRNGETGVGGHAGQVREGNWTGRPERRG